jgi:hypothetical protein
VAYLTRYFVIALLSLVIGVPAVQAEASEQVTRLHVKAELSRDNVLGITETIDYDFGGQTPHAVTRTLPLTYRDNQGTPFPVSFRLQSVELDGSKLPLQPSLKPDTASLELPEPATGGAHQYRLRYQLSPVVIHGDMADVLRVPLSGLRWTVPIQLIQAELKASGLSLADPECQVGTSGGSTGTCRVEEQSEGATFTTTAPLMPAHSFSISAVFPKNSFSTYLRPVDNPASFYWMIGGVGALIIGVVGGAIWLARRSVRRYTEPV